MTLTRRRFKQTTSLTERLELDARLSRERVSRLPPGKERDTLLNKALANETVAHPSEWLNPPGLQPPK